MNFIKINWVEEETAWNYSRLQSTSSYHLEGALVGVCQQGRPSEARTLAVPAPAEAPEALGLPRVRGLR